MDAQALVSKIIEDYPALLIAEVLVLLTLATVGLCYRHFIVPWGEWYIDAFRFRRIKFLIEQVDWLSDLLKDDQRRLREMIYYETVGLFNSITIVTGFLAIVFSACLSWWFTERNHAIAGVLFLSLANSLALEP